MTNSNSKKKVYHDKIEEIEMMYNNYFSITEISRKLGLNRKIVAHELSNLGYSIHSDNGYKSTTIDKFKLATQDYLTGKDGIANLSRKYRFDPCRFSLYLYDQGINVKNSRVPNRLRQYENCLKKALNLYTSNHLGVREISKSLGIPRHYVQYYLQKNGLDTIKEARLYKVDETVFEKLNTEEDVYWFGYLMADGNVFIRGRYVLELASKDKEHLEKFRNFIKTDAPISEKKSELFGKIHLNYRIVIHNKKIVTNLIKLGLLPNKSLILNFPTDKIIPNKLLRHFIRGYFDGDGHLSPFQRFIDNNEQFFLIFVGTNNFIEKLPEIFKLNANKLTPKGKSYSLRYGGNKRAFGIAQYLYQDAEIYLDRKYAEYIKWKNHLLK